MNVRIHQRPAANPAAHSTARSRISLKVVHPVRVDTWVPQQPRRLVGALGKSSATKRLPRSSTQTRQPAADRRHAVTPPPKPDPTTTASYGPFTSQAYVRQLKPARSQAWGAQLAPAILATGRSHQGSGSPGLVADAVLHGLQNRQGGAALRLDGSIPSPLRSDQRRHSGNI
jgi:hypothetical protein